MLLLVVCTHTHTLIIVVVSESVRTTNMLIDVCDVRKRFVVGTRERTRERERENII